MTTTSARTAPTDLSRGRGATAPVPAVDHVLLTRFNLPSRGAESLIRAHDGWLRRRVELFERFCLPSVVGQTTDDFGWIVYFDTHSPGWLRERIETWQLTSPLTGLFRDEVPRATLLADLATLTGAGRSHLLTTNLDNDDGLARDFVNRLQSAPGGDERTALYCTEGLIASGERVFRRRDRRNAFCSVREPWTEAMTCWSEWHNLLDRHMPVIEVGGEAAWLQVVHGENVSNRVRGRLVSPTPFRQGFPDLIDDIPALDRATLRRDHLVDAPLRAVRDGLRTSLRSSGVRILGKDRFDLVKSRFAGRRRDRSAGRTGN